jgi:bacterioferritin-associated ferredoxin
MAAASAKMADHNDVAVGGDLVEPLLHQPHRNIDGTGDRAVRHLLDLAHVEQERWGGTATALLELVYRYRFHFSKYTRDDRPRPRMRSDQAGQAPATEWLAAEPKLLAERVYLHCNGLTERRVGEAVQQGARSHEEVYVRCDCVAQCYACAGEIDEIVRRVTNAQRLEGLPSPTGGNSRGRPI